jgi:hypothetical protein
MAAKKKVTKKGIALTAAIMGGFVAASFLVYLIPTQQNTIIQPTDPEAELIFAMDRNRAIVDNMKTTLDMWKNNQLSKEGFSESAAAASSQINDLTLELRRTAVPQEWSDSYVLFIQALENYKAYFEKTKEYVNAPDDDTLNTASELLDKANGLEQQSRDAMP